MSIPSTTLLEYPTLSAKKMVFSSRLKIQNPWASRFNTPKKKEWQVQTIVFQISFLRNEKNVLNDIGLIGVSAYAYGQDGNQLLKAINGFMFSGNK